MFTKLRTHYCLEPSRETWAASPSPRGEQEDLQLGHGHLRGREGGRGAIPLRRPRRLQLHDELQDALHLGQAQGVHGGA